MSTSREADLSKLRIDHDAPSQETVGRKNKLRLILPILVGIAVVVTLILSGVFKNTPEVETTIVTQTAIAQGKSVLAASGYVVAQRKAAIASKGTGRLVMLAVVEGDHVKKGMLIGQLEDGDVLGALAQAKANYELNKADLVVAQQNLERTRKLFASNLASQADLDAAEAQYNKVIASINVAKALIDQAEVALENTRIRAPFDGTVLTKDADVGEVIAPFGTSLGSRGDVVTLADMNSLQVEADVSESNIERVITGQPCEITLDAYPNKRYRGEVTKIVPTVDRSKATVRTKVKFLDKDDRVLPDMSAKVSFLTEALSQQAVEQKPMLLVNSTAVITHDKNKIVFIVRDNILTETPVTLGSTSGNAIEVLAGLANGDRVVLNPSEELHTGQKIKIKQQ